MKPRLLRPRQSQTQRMLVDLAHHINAIKLRSDACRLSSTSELQRMALDRLRDKLSECEKMALAIHGEEA